MTDLNLGVLPPNTTGTCEQVQKMLEAIAAAQGEFAPVTRNREVVIQPREGRAYQFTYADLGQIRGAATTALAKHGLGWHSATFGDVLRTALTHAAGASLFTECAAPKMVGDPKQYGGQVTYLRRYHLSMLLGIAADDDIDEDTRHAGDTTFTGDEAGIGGPSAAPAPMQRKAAASGAKIDAGSVAWINRKIKALGMDAPMIEAMFTRLQIPLKTPAELTAEEFAAVKTELTKASAL